MIHKVVGGVIQIFGKRVECEERDTKMAVAEEKHAKRRKKSSWTATEKGETAWQAGIPEEEKREERERERERERRERTVRLQRGEKETCQL